MLKIPENKGILNNGTYGVCRGQYFGIYPEHIQVFFIWQKGPPHETALLLNVPESYLEFLWEEKKIPFVMNKTKRKVRYGDVINYRTDRDMKHSQGLVQPAAMAQQVWNLILRHD